MQDLDVGFGDGLVNRVYDCLAGFDFSTAKVYAGWIVGCQGFYFAGAEACVACLLSVCPQLVADGRSITSCDQNHFATEVLDVVRGVEGHRAILSSGLSLVG